MTSVDWGNVMTGETLTGYQMPTYLSSVLDNNLNCVLS